jgi:hypothetical protein
MLPTTILRGTVFVMVCLAFAARFANAETGDFNPDGVLNGQDVDALVIQIAAASHDPLFDLTNDGLVDSADLLEWLALAGAANLPSGTPYPLGDANLDSFVDEVDFAAWNANRFSHLAAWTGGDFTANGFVDGQDFVLWNANKLFAVAASPVAVPEPDGFILLATLAIAGVLFRSRHRT